MPVTEDFTLVIFLCAARRVLDAYVVDFLDDVSLIVFQKI